jgi:hypothetical protein
LNNLKRNVLNFQRQLHIDKMGQIQCLLEINHKCGSGNSQKLEQLQLEAARVVTGLPIFTKTEILYIETGWELLSVRRKRRKLQLFFII